MDSEVNEILLYNSVLWSIIVWWSAVTNPVWSCLLKPFETFPKVLRLKSLLIISLPLREVQSAFTSVRKDWCEEGYGWLKDKGGEGQILENGIFVTGQGWGRILVGEDNCDH